MNGAHSVPLSAASARVPLETSSRGGTIPAIRSMLKRAVTASVESAHTTPSTWIAIVTDSQVRCRRSTRAAVRISSGEG